MPFPLIPFLTTILPAVGAASQMMFGAQQNRRNVQYQQAQNVEDRMYQNSMYEWQKRDALADWNRQNDYNSPMQQMQRLREAGLNPNLVYGKGADNTAAVVRSYQAGPQNKTAPQVDMRMQGTALQTFQSMLGQKAQIDNLHAQNNLIKAQQIQTAAQTVKTLTEGERGKFDLDQARMLNPIILNQAMENLTKTQEEVHNLRADTSKKYADITFTLSEDERRAMDNAASVALKYAQILQTKEQTEYTKQLITNLQQDQTTKELENRLRVLGLNPSDPTYMRILAQWVMRIEKDVDMATWLQQFLNNK